MIYRLLLRLRGVPGVARILCWTECGETDTAIYTCDRCRA